jgi:2-hydroxyglutarate dehydrogenase
VGTETSSRNSEVIHAGLYYGPDSLKTRLCIRGKELLYETCAKHGIPHRNTGKWIVAQDEAQMDALFKVHAFAQSIGVSTRFLTSEEAKQREPDVRARAGVLESPTTGIVDSHGLMAWLEGEIQSSGGEVAFHTSVAGISKLPNGEYEILTQTSDSSSASANPTEEPQRITTETLINAAGLQAIPISNMLLPPGRQLTPYYAKGTYFSYSAPTPKPTTLVYPAPVPGHGGLGTHLTLDLSNPPRVRFGPDVEWVASPDDYTPNAARMAAALDDIETYLPGIQRDRIEVDYCGIRPKLAKAGSVTSGKGFHDFYIRQEDGFEGFVNLLGIESPGLTSSLAIGDYVEDILYGSAK